MGAGAARSSPSVRRLHGTGDAGAGRFFVWGLRPQDTRSTPHWEDFRHSYTCFFRTQRRKYYLTNSVRLK